MNHSQAAIWTWKPRPSGPVTVWSPVTLATAMSVTRAAVISTTNMTGFLMRRRGSSLRMDSGRAARSSVGIEDAARLAAARRSASRRPDRPKRWKRRVPRAEIDTEERHGQESLPAFWSSCSTIGSERERREERQRADDDDHADEQDAKSGPVVGKVPSDGATRRLAAIEPARARIGMIIPYRPSSIAMAPVML